MPWDAFISHASEDKESFVRPLAVALRKKGLNIWYDEFTLRVGDSLRRSIDKGLANSDYGIVVLSGSFFAKKWPQDELNGLVAREGLDQKVVLPVWHDIDREQVERHSPILADRKAVRSVEGIDRVVEELLKVIRPMRAGAIDGTASGDSLQDRAWEDQAAPLTLGNLIAYARSKEPDFDWRPHSLLHYAQLRRLFVNTMAQLTEAVEDRRAREALADIYRRLLHREPDWAGVFAYQPLIYLEASRGQALIEQSILASVEYQQQFQNNLAPAE